MYAWEIFAVHLQRKLSFYSNLKEKQLLEKFQVDSAGTGGWHSGSFADSRMRKAALERGIVIESIARKITLNDFNKFELWKK